MPRFTEKHAFVQKYLGNDGFLENGDIKKGAIAKARKQKTIREKRAKSLTSRIKKRLTSRR